MCLFGYVNVLALLTTQTGEKTMVNVLTISSKYINIVSLVKQREWKNWKHSNLTFLYRFPREVTLKVYNR